MFSSLGGCGAAASCLSSTFLWGCPLCCFSVLFLVCGVGGCRVRCSVLLVLRRRWLPSLFGFSSVLPCLRCSVSGLFFGLPSFAVFVVRLFAPLVLLSVSSVRVGSVVLPRRFRRFVLRRSSSAFCPLWSSVVRVSSCSSGCGWLVRLLQPEAQNTKLKERKKAHEKPKPKILLLRK